MLLINSASLGFFASEKAKGKEARHVTRYSTKNGINSMNCRHVIASPFPSMLCCSPARGQIIQDFAFDSLLSYRLTTAALYFESRIRRRRVKTVAFFTIQALFGRAEGPFHSNMPPLSTVQKSALSQFTGFTQADKRTAERVRWLVLDK